MKAGKSAAVLMAATIFGTMLPVSVQADTAKSDITMYEPNDPVYTVTIPETIVMDTKEITKIPITASDVAYIPEGSKISVTLKSGSGTYGRLYLEEADENIEGRKPYLMTLMKQGTEEGFKNGALEKQIKGMELAAFTENGTMEYQMYPVAFDYPNGTGNLAIQKGVHYTGSMTYGIELVNK